MQPQSPYAQQQPTYPRQPPAYPQQPQAPYGQQPQAPYGQQPAYYAYGPQAPSYPYQPQSPTYGPQQPPAYPQQAPQNPAYFQQGAGYPGAHYGQQPSATPTYGAPYGQPNRAVGLPPAPSAWQATPSWAPPQYGTGYQGSQQAPAGPYGQYGFQPATFPYPPPAPPKKRFAGRVLLVLLSMAIVVGVAVPIVSAITTSGYANSSYVPPAPNPQPPSLPKVTNEATAHDTVTASTLYQQSVPNPTRCTVTAIDLSAASEAELQSHMSDVVACLMRVWDVTVSAAGFQMPRPPVVVYSAAISTSCGKLPTLNAAYCGSDQKIYYATDLPQAIPMELRSSRFIVEVIVAHEFGHAVQARTGILTAAHSLGDAASSQAESNDWSRRTELQADCLAGLFIRSVSKSAGISQQDLDNIAALMISFGDDSLSKNSGVDGGHGLGTTRKYWMQLGLASTAVNVCNTFTAAANEVR